MENQILELIYKKLTALFNAGYTIDKSWENGYIVYSIEKLKVCQYYDNTFAFYIKYDGNKYMDQKNKLVNKEEFEELINFINKQFNKQFITYLEDINVTKKYDLNKKYE